MPGMGSSESEVKLAYRSLVSKISELEPEINAESRPASKEEIRKLYNELLSAWPALEGFWVRWAHTEFRMQSSEAAVVVFKRGLANPIMVYSVILWKEYLLFKLRIVDNLDSTKLVPEFEHASTLVGNHFLSHEFWDLYLEVSENKVALLIRILTEYTIHQFAKYYAKLLEILESSSVDQFQEPLSLDFGERKDTPPTEEETKRMKEVVASKLQLQYELHLRRVDEVFEYEKEIGRTHFYPGQTAFTDNREPWSEYLAVSTNPVPLYRRLMIYGYGNTDAMLSYVRNLQRKEASPEEIKEAYEVIVQTSSMDVILHYALWLEGMEDVEGADELYRSHATSAVGKNVQFTTQYEQFQRRKHEARIGKENTRESGALKATKDDVDSELYSDDEMI